MIYIKKLTTEEIITLNEMHKNHPLHLSRRRAHALLLSNTGMSVPLICSIYNVCRQTVSTWHSKWEKRGICGLIDEPGRGRSSLLTDSQKTTVVQKVETSPRSLRAVLSEIETKFDTVLSIDTLKLICKQAGLVWKRVRNSIGAYQGKGSGETSLFSQVIDDISKQDILLADRYYCTWAIVALMMQRDSYILVQNHAQRKPDFHRGKKLGTNK